jgi:sarcosine oxidase, subunit gamma
MRSRTLDPCTIIRVQSWDVAASPPSTINELTGTAWPHEVGAIATGLVDVLCIGPTDWLIVGARPSSTDLCATLSTALFVTPFRASDLSKGYTRLEFEGPDVRELLLKGCSLDLHPTRFPTARCARTRFAGVPTVLRQHAPSAFEAIVPASYQQYLLAWIADASA